MGGEATRLDLIGELGVDADRGNRTIVMPVVTSTKLSHLILILESDQGVVVLLLELLLLLLLLLSGWRTLLCLALRVLLLLLWTSWLLLLSSLRVSLLVRMSLLRYLLD